MKLTKILKNIAHKLCLPCSTGLSSPSDTENNCPRLSIHDISTRLGSSTDIEQRITTPNTVLTAATEWDTASQILRTPSQSLSLLSCAASAAISNRAGTLIQDIHAQVRPLSFGLLPIPENGKSIHDVYSDQLKILQSEIQKLAMENSRHLTEIDQQKQDIQQLTFDLQRECKITEALQESKCNAPRKLKKQISARVAELHEREKEVEMWKTECAKLLDANWVRDGTMRMNKLLESAVAELEARSADWRKRMEEVGVLARQADRKARGLGTWWTREDFRDVDDAAT